MTVVTTRAQLVALSRARARLRTQVAYARRAHRDGELTPARRRRLFADVRAEYRVEVAGVLERGEAPCRECRAPVPLVACASDLCARCATDDLDRERRAEERLDDLDLTYPEEGDHR